MKGIFFYSLPKNANIYQDLINSIEGKPNKKSKIVSLFTKFDAMVLERIIGTENSQEFLAEYNKSATFIL